MLALVAAVSGADAVGIVLAVLRFCRKHRCRQLAPGAGPVAAPQLGAEMAEIERGVKRAVGLRQHGGNRVAEEMHFGDVPAAAVLRRHREKGIDSPPINLALR